MVNGKQLKQIGLGVAANGLLDGAIEAYHYETPEIHNKFPFIRPIKYLPPVDDWLHMGIPGLVYLVARKKKKENGVKNVALGAFLYGAGMFIHHMVTWIHMDTMHPEWSPPTPWALEAQAATAGTPTGSKGALPSHPKPVNHNVLIV